MGNIADILRKKEHNSWFKKWYADRKLFFNSTYVDRDGKTAFRGKEINTQSSYAIPIQFDLFNPDIKNAAIKNFAATITTQRKADDGTICPPYSLMTGFIGTAWINSALAENGYPEMAYKLLTQTSYPSWLYPVTQGATTIWERLNSYTDVNGFGGNNRMNSFNHYSFGTVGSWIYNHCLGIQRDDKEPGFKHFYLQPDVDTTGSVTYAKGYYESMYGRIVSEWAKKGKTIQYNFVIPANTTVTLKLKATSSSEIFEENVLLEKFKGVKYWGSIGGVYSFELSSGVYKINVKQY
jgi:alpha-L-rhamnosidase